MGGGRQGEDRAMKAETKAGCGVLSNAEEEDEEHIDGSL